MSEGHKHETYMTGEHRQRHEALHKALAELMEDWTDMADGVGDMGQRPVQELLNWSGVQARMPTGTFKPEPVAPDAVLTKLDALERKAAQHSAAHDVALDRLDALEKRIAAIEDYTVGVNPLGVASKLSMLEVARITMMDLLHELQKAHKAHTHVEYDAQYRELKQLWAKHTHDAVASVGPAKAS